MKLVLANFDDIHKLSEIDKKVNPTPWSTNDYLGSYNNKNNKIFLIKHNNQIIACITVSIVMSDAEIIQLWVRDSFQRQGIATKMLQQTINLLKHKYFINHIYLEVMINNTGAISLYKKFNFQELGTRKGYYKIAGDRVDALTMLKLIDDDFIYQDS